MNQKLLKIELSMRTTFSGSGKRDVIISLRDVASGNSICSITLTKEQVGQLLIQDPVEGDGTLYSSSNFGLMPIYKEVDVRHEWSLRTLKANVKALLKTEPFLGWNVHSGLAIHSMSGDTKKIRLVKMVDPTSKEALDYAALEEFAAARKS